MALKDSGLQLPFNFFARHSANSFIIFAEWHRRFEHYFPTARIENEPGTTGPRPGRPPVGAGFAGAPNSAAISRILPVLLSRVKVFALGIVVTVCSTTKLVGLFSLMTVRVP